jgi:hypothetical protein
VAPPRAGREREPIARGVGVDPDSTELDQLHLIYKPRGLDLNDAAWVRMLCDHIGETGSRVVIVDTLRAAATIRESNEGAKDFAALLRALSPVIGDHVSVAFLHHFTKLNETRQQRAPGDRMSGTGALRGHYDLGIFITRADMTERRMRVEVELRDGISPEPFGVRITGATSGQYGGFSYSDAARLEQDDEILGEQQVKAPTGEIAEWIRGQPHQRAKPGEICARFDIGEATLRRRRSLLAANGIEYLDAGRFSQYIATSDGDTDDG